MGAHGELPALRAVLLRRARLPGSRGRSWRCPCRRASSRAQAGATRHPQARPRGPSPRRSPRARPRAPQGVLFPSDSPSHRTGAGAIVWSASSACPGSAGARVAALGRGEAPAISRAPSTAAGEPIAPRGPLLASAAPSGRIVIAGSRPARPSSLLVIEGPAAGPFAVQATPADRPSPAVVTRAHLGDVALAARPSAGPGGLQVQIERYFRSGFAPPREPLRAGGISSATVALDFRTDALVVWSERQCRDRPRRRPGGGRLARSRRRGALRDARPSGGALNARATQAHRADGHR